MNLPGRTAIRFARWLAGTEPFDVNGCLLGEFEFHLVGVYHFDGKACGPTPGFQHGGSEQFGVRMQPEHDDDDDDDPDDDYEEWRPRIKTCTVRIGTVEQP